MTEVQRENNKVSTEPNKLSETLKITADSSKNTNKYHVLTLQELIALPRKFKKNKNIIFDATGTKYDVVKSVARDLFEWQVITSEKDKENDEIYNIRWYDFYVSEEELRKMLPFQKINHFPGSQNLGKKNNLGWNLCKMQKTYTEAYNFFPQTWVLPYQLQKLRTFNQENPKKTFIVKPKASCQGRGIFLTKDIESQIQPGDSYVVQEYMEKPFLIDGLKFDLRIYVLIKSINPLKIFVYREGLARFATEKFKKPKRSNMKNFCMHLTNYAVNKKNKNFIFNQDETRDDIGHKRSFSSILKTLQDKGHDVEKLFDSIKDIIVKTVCCVHPYLSHFYKSCRPKDNNGEICFEILGFDIILDENLKPWLLEVNHTPSFSADTPLDLHIKRSLIHDTIILANVKNKEKKKYFENKVVYQRGLQLPKNNDQSKKFEDLHLGGFDRAFPKPNENDNLIYMKYIETAKDCWDEWAGAKKQTARSQSESTHISREAGPSIIAFGGKLSTSVAKSSQKLNINPKNIMGPSTSHNLSGAAEQTTINQSSQQTSLRSQHGVPPIKSSKLNRANTGLEQQSSAPGLAQQTLANSKEDVQESLRKTPRKAGFTVLPASEASLNIGLVIKPEKLLKAHVPLSIKQNIQGPKPPRPYSGNAVLQSYFKSAGSNNINNSLNNTSQTQIAKDQLNTSHGNQNSDVRYLSDVINEKDYKISPTPLEDTLNMAVGRGLGSSNGSQGYIQIPSNKRNQSMEPCFLINKINMIMPSEQTSHIDKDIDILEKGLKQFVRKNTIGAAHLVNKNQLGSYRDEHFNNVRENGRHILSAGSKRMSSASQASASVNGYPQNKFRFVITSSNNSSGKAQLLEKPASYNSIAKSLNPQFNGYGKNFF